VSEPSRKHTGNGIWAAAILMPAGFFLSAVSKGVTRPN
jgi:hypothetical protein